MKIIFTYLLSLLFILSWSTNVIALRVTSSMIKNYAVTNKKIKNSAVTHHKIKNSAVTNRKIKNYAVSSSKIANLAVTPGKIGFYSNVIIVAPSGGDFTSPRDAVNAITDATSTNPYLVKIMPGIYDIGTSALVMKEYVDIEGSGEAVTRIQGSVDAPSEDTGVIEGASNAELRFLTVESTNAGTTAIAMYIEDASTVLNNVTAVVNAGTNLFGIYAYGTSTAPFIRSSTVTVSGGVDATGIHIKSGSATIENVSVTVSGGTDDRYGVYLDDATGVMNTISINVTGGASPRGIEFDFSDVTLMNVDVSSSGGSNNSLGIYNNFGGSTLQIHHSSISGATNSVFTASGTTSIGNTHLAGAFYTDISATATCAGVYDAAFTFYASTCP